MATSNLSAVLADLDSRKAGAVEELKAFLRFESISAQPGKKGKCRECAQWLAGKLTAAGLKAELRETGTDGHRGHPIVLAKNEHVAGRPTVLMYGHYDVQPPEPLELWTTPAFEPTVRKTEAGTEAVYARGAVDDKGQVWCHVEALAAWGRHGGLPVNVIVLVEGEEEVGSENLEAFVAANGEELKADIVVVSDTSMYGRGLPALTYGLRGLVYEEVFLSGPSHDLHSGGYGGAVRNPANAAAMLIASLHDSVSGRVNLPGFYEDVLELSAAERSAWAKLPGGDKAVMGESGTTVLSGGERGFSAYERLWARPTCDVNGLTSGYQGEGAKTVLPAKASFKISFRLVPNQDPKKILESFRRAMKERCPAGIAIEFVNHGASPASITPIDTPAAQMALGALKEGFGVEPTFIRSGGSIPVVGMLKRQLGVDTLLVGFGLPDDRVHSPDEKMDLECLYGGMRTTAVLLEKLAGLGK
jgi:acetylornithine deacetylase/succinyl-diaminopimelate desuccinylase-like protein